MYRYMYILSVENITSKQAQSEIVFGKFFDTFS